MSRRPGTRSDTRDRILAAAFSLFVEFGFQGTTLTEVERRVGLAVGTGSLYHHFRSKEELLRATVEREVALRLSELREERDGISWPDDPHDRSVLAIRVTLSNIRRFIPLRQLLQAEGARFPDLQATFETALAESGALGSWTNDAHQLVAVAALTGYEFLLGGGASSSQVISEERFISALVAMLPTDGLPGVDPKLRLDKRSRSKSR